jgi:hypothetical protein
METYAPPVDRLLTLPSPKLDKEWQRWNVDPRLTGFTLADLPELLRLARDGELHAHDDRCWGAPIHAWRAISLLPSEAVVRPLVHLLADNVEWDTDWLGEDLVQVVAGVGALALPELGDALAEPGYPDRAQLLWASCIKEIARAHPELREAVIRVAMAALERHEELDPWANGSLACTLVALKAVEAAELIEAAYEADSVDRFYAGDWPHLKHELGLGPPPPHRPSMFERLMAERAATKPREVPWEQTSQPPAWRPTSRSSPFGPWRSDDGRTPRTAH